LTEGFTGGLYVTLKPFFSCHVVKENIFKPSAVVDDRVVRTQVTVVYIDNQTEIFEAIRVTEKGIVIGRFIQNEQGYREFIECGLISNSMVKNIIPDPHK